MALTKISGSVIKDSVSLSGNVSVGGTLTYQDVTNVDALGIGTFRAGVNVSGGQLDVGSNIKIGNAGIITATELDISGDIDVDGHTNLDNVNIAGVTTSTGNIYADNYYANSFLTINNNGNPAVNITSTSTSGSSRIFFGDPDNSLVGRLLYSHNGDYMSFYTAGSEKVRIGSNGYVNIGTGTAEQQLTVQNSAQHSLIRVISKNDSDAGIDFGDTDDTDRAGIRYTNSTDSLGIIANADTRVVIDSSGRVMIGGGSSPSQVGDGQLIVYSSDRLHPAIKPAGTSNNYANGWTLLGDNYQADESQINLGVSYSSSSLVLSRGVKVSGSADDTYLSSQDSYAMRPCAIVMDELGALNFLTTETNATVATDSAVSLTNVFTIDRVGRIYQRISGRNMHFGAGNQLEIGVSSGGDPVINSAGGDLQIKDAGSNICIVRSDGFEMRKDIYFATSGMGIVLGNTSNVDANTLDDYEEGSWQPTWSAVHGTIGHIARHGEYYKIGRTVHCMFAISSNGSSLSNASELKITGLPFSATIPNANGPRGGGGVVFPGGGMNGNISKVIASGTTLRIQLDDGSFLQTNSSGVSFGYNAAQISGMFSFITAS